MDSKDKSEQLYNEFLSRLKSGEKITPEEYIQKYPDLEADLRMLFARLEAKTEGTKASSTSSHQLDILGDFRIIKEIGRGGMGVVYEAEQISLKRSVISLDWSQFVFGSPLQYRQAWILVFLRWLCMPWRSDLDESVQWGYALRGDIHLNRTSLPQVLNVHPLLEQGALSASLLKVINSMASSPGPSVRLIAL